jgi:hypothetical protein
VDTAPLAAAAAAEGLKGEAIGTRIHAARAAAVQAALDAGA